MRCWLLVALTVSLALAASATSQAAVTVGSAVDDWPSLRHECPSTVGCSAVQDTLRSRLTSAPFRGVIVRWRVRGSGSFAVFAAPYRGDDTVVRGVRSHFATPPTSAGPSTFSTRIPIGQGDRVGLLLAHRSVVAMRLSSGADLDLWSVSVPVGHPSTAPPEGNDWQLEAAYNVDIEPDVDGDHFGDETQDQCPGSAATHGPCPPPPPPPADTTAPTFMGRASIKPKRFRARRGGVLGFALSEPARMHLVVERRRRNRRFRTVATLVHQATVGTNAIRIRSRIGGRRLRAGRYRVILRAVNASGNAGAPATVRFRVRQPVPDDAARSGLPENQTT